MKKIVGLGTVVALAIMLTSNAHAGAKVKISDDSWLAVNFLGQPHYKFESDASQDDDFYLRRARIIMSGQVCDGVKFFVETDNDTAGKKGTDVSTDIQDLFIDFRLVDNPKASLWMETGLILLPFSFETKSSAASLLGIDYNSEAVKLVNTFVWRDNGAELHGNIGSKIACRVGIFDGYDKDGDTKSDEADLRYTGHLAVNLIGDAETGPFFSQSRLGKKGSYLSIGAGFDHQSSATSIITEDAAGVSTETGQQDSDAWVVDFQSGFNINDMCSLTVNGGYYDWDNAIFDGNTTFTEAGVLVSQTMITGKYALQDPSTGDSIEDYTVGLNYFIKGHNARGGVEYRWGDSNDQTLVGLQFLL